MCSILSILLAVLVAGGAASAVTLVAPDGEPGCEVVMAELEPERAVLPPGWGWREWQRDDAGWRGTAEWMGADLRAADVSLSCWDDGEQLLKQWLEIDRPASGGGGEAWPQAPDDQRVVLWRTGGIVGRIEGRWNASLRELLLIAGGLDTVIHTPYEAIGQ